MSIDRRPPEKRIYRPDPTASLDHARSLRREMTRYEVKLWLRLRELKAQGFRFRRQARIERWIADFACFTSRMVVEVDGDQHGFEDQARRDGARDAFLAGAGFLTLRFTNNEVWENIEGVVETIFRDGVLRLVQSQRDLP